MRALAKQLMAVLVSLSMLTACSPEQMYQNSQVKEANVTDRTRAGSILTTIPAPTEKVAVALYDFQDQTGQFKNNDKFTDYSSAVTKGGHAILTKALLDAGGHRWFTVTERGGLKDLLQERSIIKVTRAEYKTAGGELPALPPLVYGGMLIEGGIISYDSNVVTGGAGATYLGIGGNVQYHRDLVTVYLRAVSIQTGEVVLSVTSSKTIFSTSVDSNVLKYITFDRLLQAEAGFTVNEPTQLCVRQAIETAVYSMIMEGAMEKLWTFQDHAAGEHAIAEYVSRRDGTPAPEVAAAPQAAPQPQAALQPLQQLAPPVIPASAPAPQAATMQAVPVAAVTQQNIAAPIQQQQQQAVQAAVQQAAARAPSPYTQVIQNAQTVQQNQYNAQQRTAPQQQPMHVAATQGQTNTNVEVMPMSARVSNAPVTAVPGGSMSGAGRSLYQGDGT